MATDTKISSLIVDAKTTQVAWADGRNSTFHHVWLRDNCRQLLHANTQHRVVETSEIPANVRPSTAEVDADGAMVITWAHDGHVSTFQPEWLQAHDYSNGVAYPSRSITTWDVEIITPVLPRCTHADLMNSPANRAAFLEGFMRYGLAILNEVPCELGTVAEVAKSLGEMRLTSWGRVFDVISMPDANSVAYTSLPLVTHTDEGYRDPAPTIQLTHFLIADSEGGASTLVDGFKVAEDLRRERPDMFELLSTTTLDFHIADANTEHHARGPVITVNPDRSIRQIRYSNHSALPFLIPADRMEAFYDAYRTFGRMRESAQYCFQIALGAGDMYIVDNHRVMHGRTGFTSGGARHLRSCYVERDEVASRLAMLERQLSSR